MKNIKILAYLVGVVLLSSCSEDKWEKHDIEDTNVIRIENIDSLKEISSIDFYSNEPKVILDKSTILKLAKASTLLAKEDNSTADSYILDFVVVVDGDTCNYHAQADKNTMTGSLVCQTLADGSDSKVQSPFKIKLMTQKSDVNKDIVDASISYDTFGLTKLTIPKLADEYHSTPFNDPDNWVKNDAASLDFDNENEITNSSIWEKITSGWSSWAFDASNVTVDSHGKLNLTMTYAGDGKKVTYTQKGTEKQYNYVSGMLNTKPGKYFTYGYFEARIKGTSVFPGTCPAFWLWSNDSVRVANKGVEGKSCYNEIDIVEMQQVKSDIKMLECNLHAMMTEGGVEYYKRPRTDGGKWADICQNQVVMDWNPSDDYHTYAVENRPDSIFWFVDDVLIAKKENIYWHLPMQVTLSLGLRSPYEYYDEQGVRHPDFEKGTSVGFPTAMKVDFVHIWEMKK